MFGRSTLVLIALGCGGSGRGSETLVPAASAGDEPPPSAAVDDSEAKPARRASNADRGRIVINAKCAGQSVAAHAHMPIERGLVVDFEMGQEISAEAGTRHIEVTMTDDIILVDKPTIQLEVEVEPKKLSTVDLVIPWAKVQLNVLAHGTLQPPTAVKLLRRGELVAEVKSGGPAFLVTPGTYEAEVKLRGKTLRVKGLVFFEGTEQVVPVRALP